MTFRFGTRLGAHKSQSLPQRILCSIGSNSSTSVSSLRTENIWSASIFRKKIPSDHAVLYMLHKLTSQVYNYYESQRLMFKRTNNMINIRTNNLTNKMTHKMTLLNKEQIKYFMYPLRASEWWFNVKMYWKCTINNSVRDSHIKRFSNKLTQVNKPHFCWIRRRWAC